MLYSFWQKSKLNQLDKLDEEIDKASGIEKEKVELDTFWLISWIPYKQDCFFGNDS